jgi:hypothetical protein
MIAAGPFFGLLSWFLNTIKTEGYETVDTSLLACLFG